jgi:archaellum component FlaG (FlaF/FlaG flagellin family)
MIKTILTGFVLGLILILFVPAILILASWNAVPGDSTYSIKVGLEKAILGVTPSDNLKTALEIKFTNNCS